MANLSLEILVVEDNLTDVLLLRDALEEVPTVTFVLTHVERLDASLKCLETRNFDAVLLDLGLPDSQGLATLNEMQSRYPAVPIMVLSGLDDENIAVSAVQGGAQDYLVKGKINGTMIALTIRYAIERKRSEQRLRASEVSYRRLFETAQDGIFLLDAGTGQVTDANPYLEKLLGYSTEELRGKRLWEIGAFRDRLASRAAFRTLQKRGYIRYEDLPLAAKDGRFIPVEFISNVYSVGAKQVIQCNIRDISERKRVEMQLQASEANLAKSQQLTHMGSWELDLSNLDNVHVNSLRWSDETFRILGYTPGEFEPTNAAFFQAVHPEDRSTLDRAMTEAIGGGKPYSLDHRIVLPDGRERIIHAEAEIVYGKDSGKPLKIVGVGQDITERKQAEKAVEAKSREIIAIWERMTDAFFSLDNQWRFTHINPQAVLLVQKKREELIGINIWEAFPQSVNTTVAYEEYHRAMREQISVVFEDFSPRLGKAFEVHAYPSSTGLSVYFRDITERKQSEEKIRYLTASANCLLWIADVVELDDGSAAWTYTFIDEEAAQRFLPLPVPDGMPYLTAAYLCREPEDVERTNQHGWKHIRQGEDYTQEFRVRGMDGQQHWQCEDVRVETIAPGKWRVVGVGVDITSQKNAEAQLQFQKTLLEAQSEASPDGILAVSNDGQILSFNQRYVQMWGIPPEVAATANNADFRRVVLDQLVNPKEVLDKALALYQNSDERSHDETLLKDGRIVERYSAPILRPDNSLYGRVWYMRDITERKQAERALIESEQRLTLATESAGIGIWDRDVVANQMIWDPQMYALYGIREEDFNGAYGVWEKGLHPDDREEAEADLSAALEGIREFHPRFRVVWPNGEVRHIRAHATVLRASDGAPLRMIGVNWDITEQTQAEEERDRFFTMSLDMLAIGGIDGYFKRLNPAFSVTLGYTEAELLAVPFLELIHPEDRAKTQAVVKTLSEGIPVVSLENRYRHKDGGWRWIEWKSAGVPETGLIYTVARDITERKEREESLLRNHDALEIRVARRTAQLARANAVLEEEIAERQQVEEALQVAKVEAERANVAKSEFLSRMSHELRTPLNAIIGFGQILAMRNVDANAQQQDNIQQVLKAGRHLLGLINEVLDIARIEAGHLSLSPEPIEVDQLVQEVVDMIRPLSATRGIQISNNVRLENGALPVLADQQRLKQVLLNFLSNAVKYNRDSGSVFVSCELIDGPSVRYGDFTCEGSLRLLVKDTGPGLTPQEMGRLFMPFERLGADQTQIEGSGIGLSLCKPLVEAMHGKIGVISEAGKGCTFWLELPRVALLQAYPSLTPGEEAKLGLMTISVLTLESAPTILYIEDNLSNISLIERVLSNLNPQIKLLTAMQGRLGLELAAQHHPDLILLDLNLPDIMGDEVLHRLKSDPATQSTPVMVLSADATPRQIERLRTTGAAHYLTKPLDLQQFTQVLVESLKNTTVTKECPL